MNCCKRRAPVGAGGPTPVRRGISPPGKDFAIPPSRDVLIVTETRETPKPYLPREGVIDIELLTSTADGGGPQLIFVGGQSIPTPPTTGGMRTTEV